MKIAQFKRKVTISTTSYATGDWTLNTSAPHLLAVGDTFQIANQATGDFIKVTTIAGTTGSVIKFTFADANAQFAGDFFVYSFPAGFSGVSEVETLGTTISTVQATTTTTSGNGSHSVLFQYSNDKVGWITVATSTPASAASPVTDGFALQAPWLYVRLNVTSVTGTGAKMIATLSGERV